MYQYIFDGTLFDVADRSGAGKTTQPSIDLAKTSGASPPPRVRDLTPEDRAALDKRCPGLANVGAALNNVMAWGDHVLPEPLWPFVGHNRWVAWKWVPSEGDASKLTKPPFQAALGIRHASNSDPDTWCGYERAKLYVDQGLTHGVGFVLKDFNVCAFDMDHCFDPAGELYPSARALVERCGSYTEWTPSRDGLRIIGTAPVAGKRQIIVPMPEGWRLEVYEAGGTRYITVSGRPFEAYCLPVAPLGDVFAEYFKEHEGQHPTQQSGDDDDTDVDWAKFCSAVRAIPNDGTAQGVPNWERGADRSVWVPLGACIYRTGHPDAGKLFNEFSKKSPRYRLKETRRVWRTFEKNPTPTGGRVWTAGTVYWIAEQNGWNDPSLGPPLVEVINPVISDEDFIALYPASAEVLS